MVEEIAGAESNQTKIMKPLLIIATLALAIKAGAAPDVYQPPNDPDKIIVNGKIYQLQTNVTEVGIRPDSASNDNIFGWHLKTNGIGTNLCAPPASLPATDANAVKKDWGKYDLTIGGDGFTNPHTLKNGFEIDVGLSSNPFKKLSNLWIGIDQAIGREPSLSGSTDLTAYWPVDVYKGSIYINPGWSGGVLYGDGEPSIWRTGPIVEGQYYVTDNSFVYTDINYDLLMSKGNGGFRYSIGIGIEW